MAAKYLGNAEIETNKDAGGDVLVNFGLYKDKSGNEGLNYFAQNDIVIFFTSSLIVHTECKFWPRLCLLACDLI